MLCLRAFDARFYANDENWELVVNIWPLKIVQGDAPAWVRAKVLVWASNHQEDLLAALEPLQAGDQAPAYRPAPVIWIADDRESVTIHSSHEQQKAIAMKAIEIAFTGYAVTDIKRARAFYGGVLGLKESAVFGDDTAAWIEYEIGSGTLAITNMIPDWKPSPGGTACLEVEDFGEAVRDLKASGAVFLNEPMDTPVCQIAILSDPDGNSLAIHKRKA
jgi:predicted enzyme related to lactoylglutathione lyase